MLELTRRLVSAADGSGPPVVAASVLEPGPLPLEPGARLLVEQDASVLGSLGDPELDALLITAAPGFFASHSADTVYVAAAKDALSRRAIPGAAAIYVEVVEHKPVFLVVGAGHVGRAVATLANFLGFHVAVLDDREDFADPEKLPMADEVICEDFEAAIDRYPITSNTHITLVTRGHKQDEFSLRRCLGRGAGYLGMIGSRRRTRTVLEHLREEGFDPAELDKVRTPIGLDIGAETPEEIAVAVLAEVILLRAGGTGAPMYHR